MRARHTLWRRWCSWHYHRIHTLHSREWLSRRLFQWSRGRGDTSLWRDQWVTLVLLPLWPSGLQMTAISVTRLGDLLHFGNFLKPLATINLPKLLTFLGTFCKGVKIYHFSSEINFGQLLQTFGDFFLVTLTAIDIFALIL